MKNLLVSVCIPAYKQPDMLLRAVLSALAQEGCEFEVVITDDSPDDIVEKVLEPFFINSRIVYFRNPIRLGAVGNWNESMRRASGQIVKILHHDDWFAAPSSLIEAVEPIFCGRARLTFSACRAMNQDEKELFSHCATERQLNQLLNARDGLAFANFLGPPSVLAFDRSLNIKFDSRYTWLADVDFYLRALDITDGQFVYLKSPLILTTAESPLQLSRDCEINRIRSISEYVLLFSSRLSLKRCGLHAVSHFSSLIHGISRGNFFSVFRYALQLHSFSVAIYLLLARVLPRRMVDLCKWK